jgi:hypothetical protein
MMHGLTNLKFRRFMYFTGYSDKHRGVLWSVVCQSVIVKPQKYGGPGPLKALAPWGKILTIRNMPKQINQTLFCEIGK